MKWPWSKEKGSALVAGGEKALSGVDGGWFPLIVKESYAGAWQQNVEVKRDTVLGYHAVFACISLIAGDVSKMPALVTERDRNGIWSPNAGTELARLLKKPNSFQTRIQFFANWINSKMSTGNTYVIKLRNRSGKVVELRVLDPYRVRPLVSDSGEVYYEVSPDNLSGLTEPVTMPAREIIHDRFNCLFHPLVGLSPIFACGLAATQGETIQQKYTAFIQNGGKPSGIITIPGNISEEMAKTIKANWDSAYTGRNAGKTGLLSNGATYTAAGVSPVDSQMIEQLTMTAEIVCSVFHVPAYKAGVGSMPTYDNIEALEQQYFAQCLQVLIEEIEVLLGDHFDLSASTAVKFDTNVLLRMDTERRHKALSDGVKGSWLTPNEARRRENLPPVAGGDSTYMQQQNYSLGALAKRDASDNPFSTDQSKSTSEDDV